MLQQLISLAPETLRREPAWVVVAALVTGVGLWLAGWRFSRPTFAIGAAAAGGFLAAQLPRWCGWGVSPALAGVAGAALLGGLAFLLDHIAVGLLFGLTLAFWAAVAAWATLAPDARWVWPTLCWTPDPSAMGLQLWQICPADLRTSLPGAAACALVMGMSLGMLWPRLSRAILCDLLGLSLIVAVALPAIDARQPGRIASVLPGSLAQAVTLATLFAVGLGVQWWWIRRTTLPRARRNARNGRRAARHPLFPGAALPDRELAEFFDDGADDAATPAVTPAPAPVPAARGMQMPRMTPDVRMVA